MSTLLLVGALAQIPAADAQLRGQVAQLREAKPDLTLPTVFYLGSASAEWATASAGCLAGCRTRTALLPNVTRAKVAVPLGLAIDGVTLWLCHEVIGKRWPRVGQGVLYGLAIARAVNASQHIDTARRRIPEQ